MGEKAQKNLIQILTKEMYIFINARNKAKTLVPTVRRKFF